MWPFLRSFNPSFIVMMRHRHLEKNVLTTADVVTTITPLVKKQFEELSGRTVTLITNGYDAEDFGEVRHMPSKKFVLLHVGIVYSVADPSVLIDSIQLAFPKSDASRDEFEWRFVGEVNSAYKSAIINSPVGDLATFVDPVSHKELMKHYSESSMLFINLQGYDNAEGLLPGKCFEYLACKLPILGIGPKVSDMATLLNETGAGKMFGLTDENEISAYLRNGIQRWKNGKINLESEAIEKYERKYLTMQLVELLEKRSK
jgi:glycosyltransferase involved in cell wall biosynthesis